MLPTPPTASLRPGVVPTRLFSCPRKAAATLAVDAATSAPVSGVTRVIRTWTWIHGHGHGYMGMGMDTWIWIHGHGYMGMDTWAWIHGHGYMGMDA